MGGDGVVSGGAGETSVCGRGRRKGGERGGGKGGTPTARPLRPAARVGRGRVERAGPPSRGARRAAGGRQHGAERARCSRRATMFGKTSRACESGATRAPPRRRAPAPTRQGRCAARPRRRAGACGRRGGARRARARRRGGQTAGGGDGFCAHTHESSRARGARAAAGPGALLTLSAGSWTPGGYEGAEAVGWGADEVCCFGKRGRDSLRKTLQFSPLRPLAFEPPPTWLPLAHTRSWLGGSSTTS
jgi:hypothetical protein